MADNPLKLDPNYILVAAIDFGTTYSGYAFSFRGENQSTITLNSRWHSSSGTESEKCPTAVLIGPDGNLRNFGYGAEDDYNQSGSDEGLQLYRQFKMTLHKQNINMESAVESVSGNPEKAITVFTMALRFLKNHMLEIINKAVYEEHGDLSDGEIRWVLTVPAIWGNDAKAFMRLAAHKAGLIPEPDSNTLIIALEPEVASFYCRNGDEYGIKHVFKSGEKMLVIDAGGGTVDITAHEMLIDGQVKEIAKPSGGPWGGTSVDRAFIKLLTRTLGPDFINHMKSKQPQQWIDFIMRFEKSKKAFKVDGRTMIKLPLPHAFFSEYKSLHGEDLDTVLAKVRGGKVGFVNGFLTIKHDVALELYNDSCSNIIDHVKTLLQSPALSGLTHIFLVGGYGEASVLQNGLQVNFGTRYKIVVPLAPQLAIVKGAVLFGHTPTKISSRLSTNTYGCAADLLFDESKHDPRRKYQSRRDGRYRCKGTFREFVKIDDEIKNPEVKTHMFHPISKNETQVTIPILKSKRRNVVYCDEPEVYKAGEVKLESPLGPLGDDIELRITFGHTEILLEARDTKRGEGFPVKTSLMFHSNH